MAKFCGKCGARLSTENGLCPNCDRKKIMTLQKVNRKQGGSTKKKTLMIFVCSIIFSLLLFSGLFLVWQMKNYFTETTEESKQSTEFGDEYGQTENIEIVTDEYFDGSFSKMRINVRAEGFPEEEYTYYFHIPRVNLDLPGIEKVNEKIYDDLYYGVMMKSAYAMPEPYMDKMAYTYCEKEDILSILVCVYDRFSAEYADDNQYWVYNISKTTGTFVSDAEVFERFGMTDEEYGTLVRRILEEKTWYLYEHNGMGFEPGESEEMDAYYQGRLRETLAPENAVMPYIDAGSGDLCIATSIYTVYGDGKEQFTLNLTGTSEPCDPAEYRDITHRWGKSQTVWDELTISQFYEIRDLLGVPECSNLTFDEGVPYYRDGITKWIRHVNIGIDGKEVAGATVSIDPCELHTEIMMYSPEYEFAYTPNKKSDKPLFSIEGTWMLNAEENRNTPAILIFRNDGNVEVTHPVGAKEVLPYRIDALNTSLYIGSEKYLFSVWFPTLYLFPEGQIEYPVVYEAKY